MNDRLKLKDRYFQTEVIKSSNNRNWKGGIYIAGGYIKVKVKDHPAKDKRNYVLLHRLVMEDYLGRYLKDDEFIHHKDGNKLNNDISNLELIYSEKHAKEHYSYRKIDKSTGKFICDEPKFNEIMLRLYDKDRNCVKEYTLSKLIYTKFKGNKFEYRGISTGLKDKNGKLIYESDRVKFIWQSEKYEGNIIWYLSSWGIETTSRFINLENPYSKDNPKEIEIIGNIHENPELMEEVK